jgi:hypothetical protein
MKRTRIRAEGHRPVFDLFLIVAMPYPDGDDQGMKMADQMSTFERASSMNRDRTALTRVALSATTGPVSLRSGEASRNSCAYTGNNLVSTKRG